jgi:hypothetical protein
MSAYGAASSTKRWPLPFTSTQPGKLRSTNSARCFSSPGTCMVGAHQAWSVSAVAAPSLSPASSASPVLLGGVALHWLAVGPGRKRSRKA